MNVNATLLIQAINFFLAYIMIRRLLLIPVVVIITEQEAHSDLIEGAISQLQESLNKAKRSRRQLWIDMQEYFNQKSPSLSEQDLHVFKGIAPEMEPVVIDQQVKQDLVKNAADSLTNAILDK